MASQGRKNVFYVVGLQYRKANVKKLLDLNYDYTLSASELKDMYGDGDRVYKYEAYIHRMSLIPEPENEHDPNAIRVEFNDLHIGYIKASQTSRVKKLISKGNVEYSADLIGGPYRAIYEDEDGRLKVERCESEFSAYITITPKA